MRVKSTVEGELFRKGGGVPRESESECRSAVADRECALKAPVRRGTPEGPGDVALGGGYALVGLKRLHTQCDVRTTKPVLSRVGSPRAGFREPSASISR